MLQRCKPQGYTQEELTAFISEWNELCDQGGLNPYTSTSSYPRYLVPASKFIDDPQLNVTAEQRALRFLTYKPRKRRTTKEALAAI